MKKLILILSSLVFLSSCLLEQSRVQRVKIKKQKVIIINDNEKLTDVIIATYPTQLRGTYFKNGLHCAEPAPDIGVATEAKIINKVELKGTVVKLDGRDSVVLLGREMLYRICEMGMNYPSKQTFKETKEMYESVLKTIVKLAQSYKDPAAQKTEAQAQVTTANNMSMILSDQRLTLENKESLIRQIKGFNIDNLLPK